jgi:hypothetical protein
MKKMAFVLLLTPGLASAWSVAQIQSNMQFPSATGKASCYAPHTGQTSYPFTTNAQQGTAAGTDNLRVGFSSTTNVTPLSPGVYKATGNAAITTFKAINIYYSYGGQNLVLPIPALTYWGNVTSSYRTTANDAVAFVPSTNLPSNTRLTAYPRHFIKYDVPYYMGIDLKVTITLPNGQAANFWLRCA